MAAPGGSGSFTATATTLTTLATIYVRGRDRVWITMTVTSADLTAFTVEYQVDPNGAWAAVASAAADYTTPTGPVLGASGSLVTAAAGSTVHFLVLNVFGAHAIRLKASSGTSSSVAGHYGMN